MALEGVLPYLCSELSDQTTTNTLTCSSLDPVRLAVELELMPATIENDLKLSRIMPERAENRCLEDRITALRAALAASGRVLARDFARAKEDLVSLERRLESPTLVPGAAEGAETVLARAI